jgi:hypothetical protein
LRQLEGPRLDRALPIGTPHGHNPVVVEQAPLSEYGRLMAVAV